jgi:hypothetical protein
MRINGEKIAGTALAVCFAAVLVMGTIKLGLVWFS